MNLKEELLKDKTFTKKQCVEISNFAMATPKNLKELMSFFFSNEYRLAQRTAWVITMITAVNPKLIKPYIEQLVMQLNRKDVHNAVIRNSVRILQQLEIPKPLHGRLMNYCFELLGNPTTPVAIKAFSLTTLYNLSQVYPEIKNELKLVIEERWNHETAAFKSRGKTILKKLNAEAAQSTTSFIK